ncbi:MAG TPA: hypothetical protein VHG92_15470 [Afifellaceae bacterium]|nr:hypothetical protein [Afifellaceae bacterium]
MKTFAAAAVAIGMASSAALAQQEGLVNVDVGENQVQVPIGIAAQACGVSVDALVVDDSNTVTNCELDQDNQAFQNFVNRGAGGGQGQGQGKENAPGQQGR